MKHVSLLAAAVVSFLLSAAPADETAEAQLDFVRKLRAKGYAELALEYAEKARKTADTALQAAWVFEIARARMALARDKPPEQRLVHIDRARQDLEAYVAKNKTAPEAPQARLEIARLSGLQGQALLNKALRQEGIKAQQEWGRRAEVYFIRAGQELDALIKSLPKDQALQARLERATNIIDQARSYIDVGDAKIGGKRALIVDEAKKALEGIVKDDSTGQAGLMAATWLIKCYQESQDPQNAAKFYKLVMAQPAKEAQSAQRWARLFFMQGYLDDVSVKLSRLDKLKRIQQEGLTWLKDYPKDHNSPEGYGVRFELAGAYHQESQLVKDKATAAKLQLLAQKYYVPLAESDSDYAEKANQLNLFISFQRLSDKGGVMALQSFDDCFLKAQYEMYKAREVLQKLESGKDVDKAEKESKQHWKEVAKAMRWGLLLADNQVPIQRLGDAQYYMVVAYLQAGDPHRAAVAGEALARMQPPIKRSAFGAGFALQAYGELADDPEARERLRELADFVLKTNAKFWSDDAVTPVAHYHLALLLIREDTFESYQKAFAHLDKLPVDFPGFTFAQSQLVVTALNAAATRAKSDAEKKFFQDKALAALARIQTLPPDPDPLTAKAFFHANLNKSYMLYRDALSLLEQGQMPQAGRKFIEMSAFNDQLRKQFDNLPVRLSEADTKQLRFNIDVLNKFNRYGRADTEYRAGNFDRVLATDLTGGIVDQVKKEGAKPGPIRMKDFQITGDIIGLAMRATVQKGKIAEARDLLRLLERLHGEEDALAANPANVLRILVKELEIQVRDLQKAGDQAKLDQTVKHFSAFLVELTKNPGPKGLAKHDLYFLGNCYSSLKQHDKAVEFFRQVPAPPQLSQGGVQLTEEQEQDLHFYSFMQVKLAEQLRLAGNVKEAHKVLVTLKSQPNARSLLLLDKEMNHVLEDSGLWGTAATKWGEFLNNRALKDDLSNDNRLKDLYFDGYYHYAYSTYKYSQQDKAKAAKKQDVYLRRAADYILKLEFTPGSEGWDRVGARFLELIEREPPLKAMYEQLRPEYEKKKQAGSV